jgi:hypothetical protein
MIGEIRPLHVLTSTSVTGILRQLQSWFGHQAQLRIDIAGRAE